MIAVKSPLVSIIITNYNYAEYVGDAIESSLHQTYNTIEIIVIDDGSTDDSDGVITKYAKAHKNIQYIKQKNKGVVFARNAGIERSNGDFILFLDGDDKLPAEYVETLINAAQERSLDVVYTDYQKFGTDDGESNFPEFDIEKLKRENFLHISALIKRQTLGSLRFDKNLNNLSHEDWDFFLGIAFKGANFGKDKLTKLLYRAHDYSRSLQVLDGSKDGYGKQALKSIRSFLYIVDKYKSLYPSKMDIYVDSEIVEWGRLSFERLQFITHLRNEVEHNKQLIEEKNEALRMKDKQISDIINSKRYRIGKILVSPFSAITSALGRKKNL